MSRVLVEVHKGMVTNVFSTDPKVQVFIHDKDGGDVGDPTPPEEFDVEPISNQEFEGELAHRSREDYANED